MFAMADMRGQLAAAAAVLLLGMLLLAAVRARRARGGHRCVPVATAFLGGPVVAVVFWALDVFIVDKCVNNAERFEELWPILIIGVIVGTATAFAITISNSLQQMNSDRSSEQQHNR
jgi:uncharacterized membrane protein YwzB